MQARTKARTSALRAAQRRRSPPSAALGRGRALASALTRPPARARARAHARTLGGMYARMNAAGRLANFWLLGTYARMVKLS